MKKITLIIAIAAFVVNLGFAQDTETDVRDKPHLGIKVGANLSNVYDTKGDNFNADSKFGLAAGGFLSIPIGKYIGIQPEILFSQKGYKTSGSILGISTYEFTHTSTFIDVPILLALKPNEYVTFLVGPQYSYLTKQKNVFKNSILSGQQESDFDNDNIRKNTLCFLAGVDLTMSQLVLGLRAGWDIQNNNGDGTSTDPRYKNMWFQGTIGVRF